MNEMNGRKVLEEQARGRRKNNQRAIDIMKAFVAGLRTNRVGVPSCLRSRSRTVRWPALMATGRRIYPSFSDRATTM